MATITIRSTDEIEQALDELTSGGKSRSAVVRDAIVEAAREHRRARLRAEAERLRNDPQDVVAAQQLETELDELSAW